MVSYLTFDEVGITAAVIASALAFVVLTWNAIKAIHDWRQLARKPSEDKMADHERRIAKLEECCSEVRGKLDADWEWQRDAGEMNKLMLRSIKVLLQHVIDGNDVDGLRSMEREIDDYLVEHTGGR